MANNPLLLGGTRRWDQAGSWGGMGAWSGAYDYTWETPDTWAEMPNWLGITATSPATYTDSVVDLGAKLQCYAMVEADTEQDAVVELRTSQNAVEWSAWRDPAEKINARYLQVRVTVAVDPPGIPTLEDLTTVIVTKVVDKVYQGLDTEALTDRYGVGDVRVPLTGFLAIDAVLVTVRSPQSAVSAVVVDKEPTGPRVRFFGSDGAPIETVFDLQVRGY